MCLPVAGQEEDKKQKLISCFCCQPSLSEKQKDRQQKQICKR